MKKEKMRKIVRWWFAVFLLCGLTACDASLEVQTDFDFEIELLPVPSSVMPGEQVELRFTIEGAEGSYDSTKYYVRYFQYSGRGTLSSEDGLAFVPNDAYRLPKKVFRLYFAPLSGSQHQLGLTFYDSFDHRHEVELNFA
ncbi:MAG: DUF3872 domain-containing protein, partial [Prevotellaceae bacterium]|nr:DUF3872 domain-containing protein [Prevotellaceae bacterium]